MHLRKYAQVREEMVNHAMHVANIQREHGERQFLVQGRELDAVDQTRAQTKLELTHFNTL